MNFQAFAYLCISGPRATAMDEKSASLPVLGPKMSAYQAWSVGSSCTLGRLIYLDFKCPVEGYDEVDWRHTRCRRLEEKALFMPCGSHVHYIFTPITVSYQSQWPFNIDRNCCPASRSFSQQSLQQARPCDHAVRSVDASESPARSHSSEFAI